MSMVPLVTQGIWILVWVALVSRVLSRKTEISEMIFVRRVAVFLPHKLARFDLQNGPNYRVI